MSITVFDILILALLLAGALWGFYRGLFYQMAALLVIYISLVVATLSYRGLSRTLVTLTRQPARATDVLAFAIILAILGLPMRLMVRDTLRPLNIDRMGMWYHITGMAFGMLNAAIGCAILVFIMRWIVSAEWPGYPGVQAFLNYHISRSWMVYVFRPFIQLLLNVVEPWLFGHSLPPLLLNALS